MKIEPGSRVIVIDAAGNEHEVTATSDVVRGRDFPVVWVDMPRHDGAGVTNMPWPADAVRPAKEEQ